MLYKQNIHKCLMLLTECMYVFVLTGYTTNQHKCRTVLYMGCTK